MAIVAVRATPVFAAAVKFTVPLPLPAPGAAVVIQDAWVAAVHAQPAGAATVRVAPPPDAGTETLAGVTWNLHGAASWLTATCTSFTTISPWRVEAWGFAATVKSM